MIKVDVAALKPTVSKLGSVARNGAKVLSVVLPAALAADKFVSATTQKTENKKLQYEFCSDFCMEVVG